MPPAFLELTLALGLASVFGIAARFFKQPLILAYIFAGLVISFFKFGDINQEIFELLSNLGIAFLLFLVGTDLNIRDLKYVGKAALYTGLGQIIFTAFVGFIILSAMGFAAIPSLYIAVAITFSSTVIIIKLLTEKHDLQSLYGKIAIGFLLVQDFVAIIALMILSGFSGGSNLSIFEVLLIFAKGAILLGAALAASKFFLRFLFRLASSSVELLFVSAISWAFLFSLIGVFFGFSLTIGAFLAGLAIASSPYNIQISARVRPLRDFFIIIFFILLGVSMSQGVAEVPVAQIIILSVFILVGNPLIVIAIMKSLGFRNRNSFLASVTVAQISEFSLILMAVGLSLGHVNSQMVALVSAVGIVTITLSSYLILYGDKIYRFVEKPLLKIAPEKPHEPYVAKKEQLEDHVVLVGCEQMGWDILTFLKKKVGAKKILVVDFNPEIVKTLTASGYNAVYGDVTDPEVLEELELGKAKLIVITVPVLDDNIQIIKFAREKNYAGPIMTASYWLHDAIRLYEGGADYVVVPETIGGKHVAKILGDHWDNLAAIKKAKSKHFEELMGEKIF
ncbi:cation:proton antiporter [Candidatus Curtissbacteria bacterium]|nr:cation:proton antiporter [Candidatus Curtissbacteria bacterium]